MSSPFSSVLEKLDSSLHVVRLQIECLEAGLELNEDQLSRSLTDARQHAAMLRDMVRAERPDATWTDRRALAELIQELEAQIAAEARRNQQRRDRLLELADELDNGTIKHRFDNRSKALNALRLKAVRELRTEAGFSKRVKDVPGPSACDWLPWVWHLQEAKESPVLAELHRNFPAVERFAAEMEEGYWMPKTTVQEAAEPTSQPPAQPEQPAAALVPQPEPQTYAQYFNREEQPAPNVGPEFYAATHTANYVQFLRNGRRPGGASSDPPQPVGTEYAPKPESSKAVEQQPDSSEPKYADAELQRLKAILFQHKGGDFRLLDNMVPRREFLLGFAAVGALVLCILLPSIYRISAVGLTELKSAAIAVAAEISGSSQSPATDSDIQAQVEQKLAALKDSSIQATVEAGVVTLVGRTPSRWDALHAESLVEQTDGVKLVRNQVQVEPASSDAKVPRRKRRT